jgi:hypothetical protein
MTNDKWHFENEEENLTLAVIRYPCHSSANGISGFLSYQSDHIFFL